MFFSFDSFFLDLAATSMVGDGHAARALFASLISTIVAARE